MDSVSHLIRLARLMAALDKRCLLAGTTVMDVASPGKDKASFHVLLDGECTIELPDREISVKTGDVVLLPNGTPHRVRTAGAGRAQGTVETPGETFDLICSPEGESVIDLFCGHYSYSSGAGIMLFRSLPDPLHVSFGPDDEVVRMLSGMMRAEALDGGAGTAVILASLCNALLAMVLRKSSARYDAPLWTAVEHPQIRTVIDAVVREPGTEWPIVRLADLAAMSRATFIRHFTRGTGMTVGAFLTRIRLMTAAELLATTDRTVATVAAEVGYHSESAFSRAFRDATGFTPARFRRNGR
jgi:AraC family transcriptional activator of mtrCDE